MINPSDKSILRGLAEQYRQISDDSIQMPRRRAWSRLNSLLDHKPLIYVRAFASKERADCKLTTTDPLARRMEQFFRYQLAWYGLGDDSIFEPYITLSAVYAHAGWGYNVKLTRVDVEGGSFKADYPIKYRRRTLRVPLRLPPAGRAPSGCGRNLPFGQISWRRRDSVPDRMP